MANVDRGVGHPSDSVIFSLVVGRHPRELFNGLEQENSNKGEPIDEKRKAQEEKYGSIYRVNGRCPLPPSSPA